MIMNLPNTLEQLCDYMRVSDENTHILSGGTDLIIKLNADVTDDYRVIDISQIEDIKGIRETDEHIIIGAMTRLSEVVDSDIVKKWAPLLCCAADQVGSTQIRNSATIGGNVANAFAGADTIPPLKALDAEVIILNSKGQKRTELLMDFIIGNRKTTLALDEVLIEIQFKKTDNIGYFCKIGSRSRVTISKLNMAIVLDCSRDSIVDAKVVVGALGATAFSSDIVANYLKGRAYVDINENELYRVLQELVDTAIPTRASRIYKREAIRSIGHGLMQLINEKVGVDSNA